MKSLIVGLCLLLVSVAKADGVSDERLKELLQKKATLQIQGRDLDSKDSSEYEELVAKRGIIGVAEIQAQMKSNSSQPKQLPQKIPFSASAQQGTTVAKSAASPSPLASPTLSKQDTERMQAALKPSQSVASCDPKDTTCKKILEIRDNPQPIQVKQAEQKVAEQKQVIDPRSVKTTDLMEQRDLGAGSVSQGAEKRADVAAQAKKAKKEEQRVVDPTFAKRMRKDSEPSPEVKSEVAVAKPSLPKAPKQQKLGAIYSPLPSEGGVKQNGFYVERDSQSIITKRIGTRDAITIKMCIAYGVSIILDESIDTELQRIILDDRIFFDAQEFENKRGVYVRLLKPIPEGSRWDSAIRLVRKSDDKTYVVNLQAVACPDGQIDFPKVVYLKEKWDTLSAKASEVMTPEDMIIQISQGLPRKNVHNVNVYDMVASPGSDWVVFGVEIEPNGTIEKPDKIEFSALDNLQINKIGVKFEYMKLQSQKATELRGKPSYRFKVMMSIDKNYVFKNRYVYLVYINKEIGHYQYIQVDTLQYFKSLKDRGFDL
jgi:hypothetical protein